jgi:transporter family-2 protein
VSRTDTETRTISPTGRRIFGVGLGVVSGVTVAVQSRINGELGVRLGDGVAAAVVSFGVGLLLLIAVAPALPAGRRGLRALREALANRKLRPWQCLGGVCGAFLVASQGLTVHLLGVAVFTVAVVAGQSTSSVVVDRAGLGPTGPQPVTVARLGSAALTVAAVVISVSDRLGSPSALALAALPALAGVGVAWQQAVNGQVGVASGSALTAALVNFTVGTAALLATYAVEAAVRGWPTGGWPDQPWWYLGGPIGIFFIAVATVLVRFTGVLLLGLATIAGQVIGAVLLDLVAPPTAGGPTRFTLIGAALTLVAVLLAATPTPPRR